MLEHLLKDIDGSCELYYIYNPNTCIKEKKRLSVFSAPFNNNSELEYSKTALDQSECLILLLVIAKNDTNRFS